MGFFKQDTILNRKSWFFKIQSIHFCHTWYTDPNFIEKAKKNQEIFRETCLTKYKGLF